MPIQTMIILSGIVFAFVIFGVVLAWGERQTRHFVREGERRSANTLKTAPSIRIIEGASGATFAPDKSRTAEITHK